MPLVFFYTQNPINFPDIMSDKKNPLVILYKRIKDAKNQKNTSC